MLSDVTSIFSFYAHASLYVCLAFVFGQYFAAFPEVSEQLAEAEYDGTVLLFAAKLCYVVVGLFLQVWRRLEKFAEQRAVVLIAGVHICVNMYLLIVLFQIPPQYPFLHFRLPAVFYAVISQYGAGIYALSIVANPVFLYAPVVLVWLEIVCQLRRFKVDFKLQSLSLALVVDRHDAAQSV